MGGAAGLGIGLGIMGGTMGGIGDIMAAHGYKRPKWPGVPEEQQRLRSTIVDQILAGGQSYLSGLNLVNQMTPAMMGLIPGMRVSQQPAAGGGPPGPAGGMQDYQTALANYQNQIGTQQQINTLTAQLKTAKGGQKRAVRQQLNQAKKAIKGMPTMAQSERNIYQAAGTPPPMTFSMGPTGGDTSGPSNSDQTAGGSGTGTGMPSAGMPSGLSPTNQSSLGSILGWLHGGSAAPFTPAPSQPIAQPTSTG